MGGARPGAAATLWEAAANARAWAASMRSLASCKRAERAWAARAKADGAIKRASEETGRVTRAPDRIDMGSMGRAAEATKRAVALMGRAAAAFGRSSRHARAASAEMRRAALAYERAGDRKNAKMMRTWMEKSREQAQATDRWAARSDDDAKELGRGYDKLAATASMLTAIGCEWDGDRGSLDMAQSDMWEDAKEEHAESAAKARIARKSVRISARAVNVTAAIAEKSAVEATAVAAREPAGPDVQEAADAWRRAMASANRVDARGR